MTISKQTTSKDSACHLCVSSVILFQNDLISRVALPFGSAADLYIKDFLHPYVEEGHTEARPLRVYYRHRWVNTIPEVILPYSLWSSEKQMFLMPSAEDLTKYRIIITTLSTARYVTDIGLPPGMWLLRYMYRLFLGRGSVS